MWLCAVCGLVAAQEADMTADELVAQGDAAYQARDFAKAAALYQALIEGFEKSPDAQDVLRRRRVPLALSHIHTKDFERAGEAIVAALGAGVEPAQAQELTFWLGVCRMQAGDPGGAREALTNFLAMFPPGTTSPVAFRIPEARLLVGSALLLEEKPAKAAAHFREIADDLPAAERGRAVVLELHALLAAGDFDAALALVKREFPRMEDIPQIVGFQTLTLGLGDYFLEAGRLRDAIACLQRVWSAERLRAHQQKRLADIETRLAAAELNPAADPFQRISLGQQAAKIRREVEHFERIENFDSALRLRLAAAYQAMGRRLEAALILEAMLSDMPPDPLVEAASVNLVQNWNAISRWPKAIQAAKAFAEVFPASASLPLVRYLQGLAEQNAGMHAEAIATFEGIATDFPQSEFAPRALFMAGFTRLLAEDNPAAIATLGSFLKKHPRHELADAAHYWLGMGYSLDKQFAKARKLLGDYLDKEDGAFRGAAFFRRAYCAQQLEDYGTSIRELTQYLQKFPGGAETGEARILLGDALMNEGRLEEGIAVLEAIPAGDARFHEEGVFKIAKALKLLEDYPRLRETMEAFVKANPKSPRVAEALYHVGWVYRQENDAERARGIYWEAIRKYGNDPAIHSVEDLFPALGRLYRGEEDTYLQLLEDLGEGAKGPLALRALWARAQALRKRDPESSRALLVKAAALVEPSTTSPLLMADIAQALADSGESAKSEGFWRDLLKWNPRAPQKDRAFAALGLLELEKGNEKAALGFFDRFERETLGSPLLGRVFLARAGLLEKRGRLKEARRSLEALLASEYAGGAEKSEALFRVGEIHMREGKPALAIPYYQRVYVMRGKWRDWVARAYFRSGEAFEKLSDTLSARRTYEELTGREDLADFEETARARIRLEALGGPIPNPSPAG